MYVFSKQKVIYPDHRRFRKLRAGNALTRDNSNRQTLGIEYKSSAQGSYRSHAFLCNDPLTRHDKNVFVVYVRKYIPFSRIRLHAGSHGGSITRSMRSRLTQISKNSAYIVLSSLEIVQVFFFVQSIV